MRAINLIPPDARRGDSGPMRAGIVSYVLIGALAVGLLAVIGLGFTSKQISDREAEVENLNVQLTEATERAQALKSFADFRALQESRTATVASLAQSRFDWQRVMNELALIIPDDVWLVQLGGSVSPAAKVEDGPDVQIRDQAPGPALELVGCATSQDAVAGFIAALEDIDGVTRVGLQSSGREVEDNPAETGSNATSVAGDSAEGEDNDECRTREFIHKFELAVAFDAVPTPATATEAPGVPAPAAPATGGASGSLASSGSPPSSAESQASDVPATPVPGG
jgi:Tfp pilus assembly protein PilN